MLSFSLLSVLLAAGSLNPDAPRRQPVDPEPERDPDPDPVIAARDIASTYEARRSYEPPPTLPPVPPDPLRRACPVCGAAPGAPCDPKRLGKAGKRGAVAHRSR